MNIQKSKFDIKIYSYGNKNIGGMKNLKVIENEGGMLDFNNYARLLNKSNNQYSLTYFENQN